MALLGLALLLAAGATEAAPLTGIKIALDPGHGGVAGQTYNGSPGDPGAVGPTGLREADCVLAISQRVKTLLEAQGATVYMTRASNVFVSLSGRTNLANSLAVDRLVSVHQNASSSTSANYTGSHVYTSASQNSINMASKTVDELDAYHKIGVVSTNCAVRGVHKDNFHMVRESNMPAQLIENTFISNPAEETRLKNTAHLNAAADAIYRGIMAHLGKTAPADAEPPTISHSAVTQAQEAAAIQVAATVTDASGVKSVSLSYRKRGTTIWTTVAMAKGAGEIYTATIPAATVTPAGVEYYVEAADNSGVANQGRLPSVSPLTPFVVDVAALPRTGSLVGILTDLLTGAKLIGAEAVLSPGGAKVFTSATGLYRFDNLSPGQYTVTAAKSGYSANASAKTVEAGATWWNSFALSPLPAGPQAGDIVINELMWDGTEYIELHNRSSRDVSIADWRITAGTGATTDRVQVVINSPAIIKAGGYYIAADAGALTGITVDEIDAQTWTQTAQVVTLWAGSPTASGTVVMDRIGQNGGAWFAGINNAKGVAMERKRPELPGGVAASWQSSNAAVGGRDGTAGAGNSSGRVVTSAVRAAGGLALAALLPSAALPQALGASLVPLIVAAGTYDGTERYVVIDGPTTVSPGSVHTYTATAMEGDRVLATQRFNVEFGNDSTVTVTRAVTVTDSSRVRVTLSGSLVVNVERQSGTISVSMNDVDEDPNSDIESKLATLIRSATSSVKVVVYALDAPQVVDALVAAAENLGSENVTVILEGANLKAGSNAAAAADRLKAAGITVIRDDQYNRDEEALMHEKFVILDDRTVWVGSANMTVKDAYQNANNVLVLRSPELAAAFNQEFQRMVNGQFGTGKGTLLTAHTKISLPSDLVDINRARASTLARLPGVSEELAQKIVDERKRNGNFSVIEDLLNVPGMDAAIFSAIRNRIAVDAVAGAVDVEVLFSPNAALRTRVVEAIDAAQTEIAFAIYTFTDPDVAAALERAKARGVRVRGVADAWQALSELSAVNGLRENGLDVKKDGDNGLMHNKFLVVDPGSSNATVITGSTNWTRSAASRNDEVMMVLTSPKVAAEYMQTFEGYYAIGR